MAVARTVVESAAVSQAIDAEVQKHSGLEDLYRGIQWRICREPEIGYPVPGTNPPLSVVRAFGWAKYPGEVVVAYSHDDNEVVLHGIRFDYPASNALRLSAAKSA